MGLLGWSEVEDPALVHLALIDHYNSRYRRHRVFYLYASASSFVAGIGFLILMLLKEQKVELCGYPAYAFAWTCIVCLLASSVLALFLVRWSSRVYSDYLFRNHDWTHGARGDAVFPRSAAFAADALASAAGAGKDVENGTGAAGDDNNDDDDVGTDYSNAQGSRLLPTLYNFLDTIADAISPSLGAHAARIPALRSLPATFPPRSGASDANAFGTGASASAGVPVVDAVPPLVLAHEKQRRAATFGADSSDDDNNVVTASEGQRSKGAERALLAPAVIVPVAGAGTATGSSGNSHNSAAAAGGGLHLSMSSSMPSSLLTLLCVKVYLFLLHAVADIAMPLPALGLLLTHRHCAMWAPGLGPLWGAAVVLCHGFVFMGHLCAWVAAVADATVVLRVARAVATQRAAVARRGAADAGAETE
jgi:hypothetical protein